MPPPEITLRPAQPADLPQVAALYQSWVEEGCTRGLGAVGAGYLEECLEHGFLVAQVEGRVAGFAIGRIHTSDEGLAALYPVGTRYLEVTELYVQPPWREQGIGTALLAALEQYAQARDCHHFRLVSESRQPERITAFYRLAGYRVASIELFK